MKHRSRRCHPVRLALFLLIPLAAAGIAAAVWFENHTSLQNVYDGKSLILVDRSDDSIFISKRETDTRVPASLAKLFVLEYACGLADRDAIVPADPQAIAMTKPGSSVAGITEQEYYLHNLYAAMLVPSGNDAV